MSADHGVRTDTGPFAIVPLWLIDPRTSPRAIQLYAILAGIYADRDGVAWPSRARLAADMGVRSLNTVDATLLELGGLGAVTIERRRTTAGDNETNRYVVHRLPDVGPPPQSVRGLKPLR